MANSVYLHIPFCKSICSYCDFCKVFYNEEVCSKYLDRLKEEVINNYNNEELYTLYIGGGTPSSLSIPNLNKLFDIVKIFNLDNIKEFTFECNIQDINKDLLEILKSNKVNRLSIGIETVNKEGQALLNRVYSKEEITSKINLSKEYFDNINLDIIYAYQDETMDILKEDLDFIASFNPEHISCYSLILEEHTKLYIDKVKPIDEDLDNKMYSFICKYLKEMGYNHIEVSNFAKEGYRPLHNLVYWDNKEYYGFGAGASGFINNKRYSNTRSITKYLNGELNRDIEEIDINKDMEYEMILGLRKLEGVSINDFYNKYNKNIKEVFDIDKLINLGLLIEKNGYISIPLDKIYISNSILVNFIGGVND